MMGGGAKALLWLVLLMGAAWLGATADAAVLPVHGKVTGDVVMELVTPPGGIVANVSVDVTFMFRDGNGSPILWEDFATIHEHKAHIVVASEDSAWYSHEVLGAEAGYDPNGGGGEGAYSAAMIFPVPGRYLVHVQFALLRTSSLRPLAVERQAVVEAVAGDGAVPTSPAPRPSDEPKLFWPMTGAEAHGMHSFASGPWGVGVEEPLPEGAASLGRKASLKAFAGRVLANVTVQGGAPVYEGDCVELALWLEDAATRGPLGPLTPHMGATAHAAAVPVGLSSRAVQAFGADHSRHMHVWQGPRGGDPGAALGDMCHDGPRLSVESRTAPEAPLSNPVLVYLPFPKAGDYTVFVTVAFGAGRGQRHVVLRHPVTARRHEVKVAVAPFPPKAGERATIVITPKDALGAGVPWAHMYEQPQHQLHVDIIRSDGGHVTNLLPGYFESPDPERGPYQAHVTFPTAGDYTAVVRYSAARNYSGAGVFGGRDLPPVHVTRAVRIEVGGGEGAAARPPATPFMLRAQEGVYVHEAVVSGTDLASAASPTSPAVAEIDSKQWRKGSEGPEGKPWAIGSDTAPEAGKYVYKVVLTANAGRPLSRGDCALLRFEVLYSEFPGRPYRPLADLGPYPSDGAAGVVTMLPLDAPGEAQQALGLGMGGGQGFFSDDAAGTDGRSYGAPGTALVRRMAERHDMCTPHHARWRFPKPDFLDPGAHQLGPGVAAYLRPARAGDHAVLFQVRHRDTLITARFVVRACESPGPGPLRWSQPCSWPGFQVPKLEDRVQVPAGVRMVLDASPPCLTSLTVDGALEVEDPPGAPRLTLCAGRVIVRAGGSLVAGRPGAPLERPLSILLNVTARPLGMGGVEGAGGGAGALAYDRLIASAGGAVQIVAKAPSAVWAHLAEARPQAPTPKPGNLGPRALPAVAPAGATQLKFLSETGWAEGDRLVLGASGRAPGEGELAVVAGVEAGGRVVTLAKPTTHQHSTHVAVLTRRAIIYGTQLPDGGGSVIMTDAKADGGEMDGPGSVAHLTNPVPDTLPLTRRRLLGGAGRGGRREGGLGDVAAPRGPGRHLLHDEPTAGWQPWDPRVWVIKAAGPPDPPAFTSLRTPALMHIEGVEFAAMGQVDTLWERSGAATWRADRPALHVHLGGPEAPPPNYASPFPGRGSGASLVGNSFYGGHTSCIGLNISQPTFPVVVTDNVCYGGVGTGVWASGATSVAGERVLTEAEKAGAPVMLQGNLVLRVLPVTLRGGGRRAGETPAQNLLRHAPQPTGLLIDDVGTWLHNKCKVFVRANVVTGSEGHGIVWAQRKEWKPLPAPAPAAQGGEEGGEQGAAPLPPGSVSEFTLNVAHSNRLFGFVGAAEPGPESCAWGPSPASAAAPRALHPIDGVHVAFGSLSSFHNGVHQACLESGGGAGLATLWEADVPLPSSSPPRVLGPHADPLLLDEEIPHVTSLHGDMAQSEIISIPWGDDPLAPIKYFSIEVPATAAQVEIELEALKGIPAAVLNFERGNLPCDPGMFKNCHGNPAKRATKFYDLVMDLQQGQKSFIWKHPNYGAGTWHLGVGGQGVVFRVRVLISHCGRKSMGIWTTSQVVPIKNKAEKKYRFKHPIAPGRYTCVGTPAIAPNTPRKVVIKGDSGVYFTVEIPERAAQVWLGINRTLAMGDGTIHWRMRRAAPPTKIGVNGAVHDLKGVIDGAFHGPPSRDNRTEYSFPAVAPAAGRYVVMLHNNGHQGRPPHSVELELTVGVDSCPQGLVGNPYHFPPHHEPQLQLAGLTRPRTKRCATPMPYIRVGSRWEGDQHDTELASPLHFGGEVLAHAHFFRFHVHPSMLQLRVELSAQAPAGAAPNATIHLRHANTPVLVDLDSYYLWQSDYSMPLTQAGAVAAIGLPAAELHGLWGDWYIAVEWHSRHPGHNFTVGVRAATGPCRGEPICSGRGECWHVDHVATCRCLAGWKGVACEVMDDEAPAALPPPPAAAAAPPGECGPPPAPPMAPRMHTNAPSHFTALNASYAPWGGPEKAVEWGVRIAASEALQHEGRISVNTEYLSIEAMMSVIKQLGRPRCDCGEQLNECEQRAADLSNEARNHEYTSGEAKDQLKASQRLVRDQQAEIGRLEEELAFNMSRIAKLEEAAAGHTALVKDAERGQALVREEMATKCYNTTEALTEALRVNEELRGNITRLSMSPRAQAAALRDASTDAALFSSDCQRTLRRTDSELQEARKEKHLLNDLLKKVQAELDWAAGQQSKGCEAAISRHEREKKKAEVEAEKKRLAATPALKRADASVGHIARAGSALLGRVASARRGGAHEPGEEGFDDDHSVHFTAGILGGALVAVGFGIVGVACTRVGSKGKRDQHIL